MEYLLCKMVVRLAMTPSLLLTTKFPIFQANTPFAIDILFHYNMICICCLFVENVNISCCKMVVFYIIGQVWFLLGCPSHSGRTRSDGDCQPTGQQCQPERIHTLCILVHTVQYHTLSGHH